MKIRTFLALFILTSSFNSFAQVVTGKVNLLATPLEVSVDIVNGANINVSYAADRAITFPKAFKVSRANASGVFGEATYSNTETVTMELFLGDSYKALSQAGLQAVIKSFGIKNVEEIKCDFAAANGFVVVDYKNTQNPEYSTTLGNCLYPAN
ncbi:MAG: hypothetical protein ISR65_03645 [Bacteriovoracaceae bacterium]|nr:hypothetical protein [Bacteriovoracaceae bacterium]